MKKSLLGLLIFCFTIGLATFAAAQDSATKNNDNSGGVSAKGQAGDTKFDIQVQKDQGQPGQQGQPGPQGAPGP
jgi:hypothetical protein